MEEEDSPPPVKRVKLSEDDDDEEEEVEVQMQVEEAEPNDADAVLQSPITVPMLVPEMWAKVFTYLPLSDLETVMNTCPEWNKILAKEKPRILLQKVIANMRRRLPWKDTLTCRLVSKASKAGVDQAYPEMEQVIRARENLARHMEAIRARIRLGMRRRAINEQREEQGLPPEVWREGEVEVPEEPDQQNEFNDDQIREYLILRLQQGRQQQEQQEQEPIEQE